MYHIIIGNILCYWFTARKIRNSNSFNRKENLLFELMKFLSFNTSIYKDFISKNYNRVEMAVENIFSDCKKFLHDENTQYFGVHKIICNCSKTNDITMSNHCLSIRIDNHEKDTNISVSGLSIDIPNEFFISIY